MKKFLLALPLFVALCVIGLPAAAKTYTKIELLTAVLNNVYAGTGKFTNTTCDTNVERPTIEITFNDIDTAGTVVSAAVSDGTEVYDATGTIKKKAGNSFYTLKLDGTYADAAADYTLTLKGRVAKTNPNIIRKVKATSVADLNEDFSVDKCEADMTFKKLIAQ